MDTLIRTATTELPRPITLGGGRLILSEPADGPTNMAIDAALLRRAGDRTGPTLRFYSWANATLSLGYFQSVAERDGHPDSLAAPVVRRASGGGALVHDRELTYSLVLPAEAVPADSRRLYRIVHNAIRDAFRDFNIRLDRFADLEIDPVADRSFLCFQRRTDEDLLLHGYKVLGSAQRKERGGLLQHGGLLLNASPYAPQLPGLGDLVDRAPSMEAIRQSLIEKLGAALGSVWNIGELSSLEKAEATLELQAKFGCKAWTEKR
ncbi:MAG: lipoate--protein ligase family protein [Planctomycetaceae bacterium]|nr:MAG: lipoate--protein ligase family protein [Planctomycetaceae bacterium]